MKLGQAFTLKKALPWVGIVLVIGGGVSYWTLRNPANAETSSTNMIRWMTVQKGNVKQTVSLSGTLNPAKEVSLTGSGKLISLSVNVGEKVTRGQVIAQLDTSSYTSQLQQAQAQLQMAKAKLAQVQEPVSASSGKGGTTVQNPDPNVVAQAQASVNQAQAQVNSVEQQINACTITSSISGTVLQVASPIQTQASTGTSSGNGGTSTGSENVIAVIADLSPADFVVQANVDQADATKIHAGQTADVALGTNSGASLTGKVVSISYLPQTQSGVTTYPVTIQLNPPKDLTTTLLPGQSVSATVVENQTNNVLTLPTAAVTQMRGTSGVYIKSDSSSAPAASSGNSLSGNNLPSGLQFQPITVGLYGGNTVEIKDGLTEGEQVAVVIPSASSSSTSQQQNSRSLNGLGMMSGLGGSGLSGSRGSYGGSGNGGSRSVGGGNG